MAVSAPGGSEGLPAQALFQKHLQAMQS